MDLVSILSGVGISSTAVISFIAVLWYETKRNKEKHIESSERVSKLESSLEALKLQMELKFEDHREKIQEIEKAYISIEAGIQQMNRRLDTVMEFLKEMYQNSNRHNN